MHRPRTHTASWRTRTHRTARRGVLRARTGPPAKKVRKKRTVMSAGAKGWWADKLHLEYAVWQGSRERRSIEARILGEARGDVTVAEEAGGWDEQFVYGQFHNHKPTA